jgi:hypothetical protein
MTFQKIVIRIAIVLLIITLIIIAYTISQANKDEDWPPVVGDCPDYWIDLEGDGAACTNTKSLGKCNLPVEGEDNSMNFSRPPFSGDNGTCAKFMWAKGCNVTWDGINSGVSNPCSQNDDDG